MTDRIVCKYRGANIVSARENVRVEFTAKPPRGIKSRLHADGFRATTSGAFEQRQHPQAIFKAQAACTEYFQPEE